METFKTFGLGQHGHSEVTVQFSHSPAVPKSEQLLLGYFEGAVSGGKQFKAGQTVGLGGHLLRLKQRADGTLGVEEPLAQPDEVWVEQVDRTLREVMLQKFVCESAQLPLTFPPVRGTCLVTACARGKGALVLRRDPRQPDWAPHDSGWTLTCDERHEHGEAARLPLLALSAVFPLAVQFLALPDDTVVMIDAAGRGRVFHAGAEVLPGRGSYLAMLNAR